MIGIWGGIIQGATKKKVWQTSRNIGGPVFVAALASVEQVLWQTWKTIAGQRIVEVPLLGVSTVWRPACAS
jgi:hypothetical protein